MGYYFVSVFNVGNTNYMAKSCQEEGVGRTNLQVIFIKEESDFRDDEKCHSREVGVGQVVQVHPPQADDTVIFFIIAYNHGANIDNFKLRCSVHLQGVLEVTVFQFNQLLQVIRNF